MLYFKVQTTCMTTLQPLSVFLSLFHHEKTKAVFHVECIGFLLCQLQHICSYSSHLQTKTLAYERSTITTIRLNILFNSYFWNPHEKHLSDQMLK